MATGTDCKPEFCGLVECNLDTKSGIIKRWLHAALKKQAKGLVQKETCATVSFKEYAKAVVSIDSQRCINRILVHDVIFQFWQDPGDELLQAGLTSSILCELFVEVVDALDFQDVLHSKLVQICPQEENLLFLVRSLSAVKPSLLAGFVHVFLKPSMPEVVQKTLLQLVQKFETLIENPDDQHTIVTAIFDFIIFMSRCCSHEETSSRTSEALECLRVVLSGRWRENAQLSGKRAPDKRLSLSRNLLQYTYQDLEKVLVVEKESIPEEPFWLRLYDSAAKTRSKPGCGMGSTSAHIVEQATWKDFCAARGCEQGALAVQIISGMAFPKTSESAEKEWGALEKLREVFQRIYGIDVALRVASLALHSQDFNLSNAASSSIEYFEEAMQKELQGITNKIIHTDDSEKSSQKVEGYLWLLLPMLLLSPELTLKRLVHDAFFHKGKSWSIARILTNMGPMARYSSQRSCSPAILRACMEEILSEKVEQIGNPCFPEIACFMAEISNKPKRGLSVLSLEECFVEVILPCFNEENGEATVEVGLRLVERLHCQLALLSRTTQVATVVSVCQSINFEYAFSCSDQSTRDVRLLSIDTLKKLLEVACRLMKADEGGRTKGEEVVTFFQDCASFLPWHLQLWFLPSLPDQMYVGASVPIPRMPALVEKLVLHQENLNAIQAKDVLLSIMQYCSIAKDHSNIFRACLAEKIKVSLQIDITHQPISEHAGLSVRALAANFTECVSLLHSHEEFKPAILAASADALEKFTSEQAEDTLDNCLEPILLYTRLATLAQEKSDPRTELGGSFAHSPLSTHHMLAMKLDFLLRCIVLGMQRQDRSLSYLVVNAAKYAQAKSLELTGELPSRICFGFACKAAQTTSSFPQTSNVPLIMLASQLYRKLTRDECTTETRKMVEAAAGIYGDTFQLGDVPNKRGMLSMPDHGML